MKQLHYVYEMGVLIGTQLAKNPLNARHILAKKRGIDPQFLTAGTELAPDPWVAEEPNAWKIADDKLLSRTH